MTKRGPTPPRKWQTMQRATAFRKPETQAKLEAMLGDVPPPSEEMWMNDKYVCAVERRDDDTVLCISIRRQDRGWPRDWRDMQRIKNDIAGDEVEAVELFPRESRLMDSANQFWLWCLRPGHDFEFGFNDGRIIDDAAGAASWGAGQRDFDE